MVLIKSISGIRGTIGGNIGDSLNPLDLVKFSSAYAKWLTKNKTKKLKIALGRDARISGEMVNNIVAGTLMGCGIDVVDLGLSTTPTVEVAVTQLKLDGGIILTASHNPKQWNALKLLNEKGEFVNAAEGSEILGYAETESFDFVDVDRIGVYSKYETAIDEHIQAVLKLKHVNINAIKAANFSVAVDCVNSTGGISIVPLLKALGVTKIVELYTEPNGLFPHNPEPLPEHLTEISKTVKENKVDVGFVVDPDVDRLAIISEDGSCFGEEYTLVACADYILSKEAGTTVSNLSSSKALQEVTEKYGKKYSASAVGEVNVVTKMKEVNAIIGGEGNGGIILPELHYGRDALVGVALFLSLMAERKQKVSDIRNSFPNYFIAKKKIELSPSIDVDGVLLKIKEIFKEFPIIDIDGVRIDYPNGWVHLRKSNTEPIIRIYAESDSMENAEMLANSVIEKI
ncbi:MAG: phosphoglucosamine mutase [Bacteroidota bacterium]